MMAPHHKGVIDMAVLELHYGHSPILKRPAQEIIGDQQREITAVYLAIHEPLPASVAAPTRTDAKGGAAAAYESAPAPPEAQISSK
jgi:uncharacterized protein (DUF305 family)